jgi:2-haloacid dehalogenase
MSPTTWGFRNLVLVDHGYDPVTTGYGYETIDTLGKVNTMLGL